MRASEACILATTEGRSAEAVVAWKKTLRIARAIADIAMHTAEVRRYNIPAEQRLKTGPNTVLVKVENLKGGWRLFLSVHDEKKELEIETD